MKLTQCTSMNQIIEYYISNQITDSGRSSTNKQSVFYVKDIDKTHTANCIDTAIASMCTLLDKGIESGIIAFTMVISATKSQTHYIPYSKEKGSYILFNYINPTLYHTITTKRLDDGVDEQLTWLVENYERDFNCHVKQTKVYVPSKDICNCLYQFYKENRRLSQIDIMAMCQQ